MTENASAESIEEYLNHHDTLTYRNVGVSMLPMLKEGRDLFTVKRKTEKRCSKYDVALFRKSANTYLLHRVIKVNPDNYIMMGDNCLTKEYDISDQDILGVMTSFVHKGKYYSVNDPGYRIYTHVWVWIYPIRVFMKRVYCRISWLLRIGK